jgi:lipid-A-disaccharide synthase
MPRIAIIAGEASGDRLGASLIRSAKKLRPDVQFEGVAGPAMREAGCRCWIDSQELSVMGLFEIVRHLPRLAKIKRQIEKRLLADPPDVLVGIDAPDFNLRIERIAHRAGIPTVHYVCPSIWAWRQSRVKVLREAADLTLCLLPFEAAFLERHATPGEFVGHPLADEIPDTADRFAARSNLGVNAETVIAMLPGSRAGEVSRLGPLYAQTAIWLAAQGVEAEFLVPAATASLGAVFEADWRSIAPHCGVRIVAGRAQECIAAADVVLVASGTATLEAMLLKRPMVVVYKMAALTYWVLKTFNLIKVKHISLPNLLSAESLVPELIQEQATPEATGSAILELLRSPQRQQELAKTFASLHDQLRRSAADRAADAVLRTGGLAEYKSAT